MEEVPPTIKTIEQFESFLRDYFLSNIPVELLSTEETWFTIRIQSTYKKKEIAVFPKFDMPHPLFGENNSGTNVFRQNTKYSNRRYRV